MYLLLSTPALDYYVMRTDAKAGMQGLGRSVVAAFYGDQGIPRNRPHSSSSSHILHFILTLCVSVLEAGLLDQPQGTEHTS